MTWNNTSNYPKAILHIDGDAFFASCEQALDPSLKGKPVVVGKERGIACAMSYEAKAAGVTRGMPVQRIKQICPNVILKSGDYESYSLFSKRMFAIMRRYSDTVEEYGIDEGFVDLTGLRASLGMSYPAMAKNIKADIEKELDITVSVGLAPTKVLAKIASAQNKPNGLTCIGRNNIADFLRPLDVAKIWGVGPNTAQYMYQLGIHTALDFTTKAFEYVEQYFTKPHQEIWKELNGDMAYIVVKEAKSSYASISKTRTFTLSGTQSATSEKTFVYAELLKNVENACTKARRYDLAARTVTILLKKQDMSMDAVEVCLTRASAFPQDITSVIRPAFETLFNKNNKYRATGVVLGKLQEDNAIQGSLFETELQLSTMKQLYKAVDLVSERFGKNTIHLAGSLRSHARAKKIKKQKTDVFSVRNGWKRKSLSIPVLSGTVV